MTLGEGTQRCNPALLRCQHWAQRYVNLAAKTINGHSLLIKIALKPSSPQANVRVRSEAPQLYGPLQAFLQKTLQ